MSTYGRKRVVQIDPQTGKYLRYFPSIKAAADKYNVTHSVITKSCNENKMTLAGLQFIFDTGENEDLEQFHPVPNVELPPMKPTTLSADYLITESGQVYSVIRRIFLSPQMKKGYQSVTLAINGKQKPIYVHRLVALAYVPNPNNLPIPNHKDGNKLNNHYTNFEWVTNPKNVQHAFDTGLNKGRCRPVYQKDIKTGEIIATFNSITEAGKMTGISQGLISQACRLENGTSNGYIWEYVDPAGKKVIPRKSAKKPVIKINLETEEETEYESVAEAAADQGISISYMSELLHGKKKIEGFRWELVEVDKTTIYDKLHQETRQWKQVHDCPDYRISSDGRIYSDLTKCLMTLGPDEDDYHSCRLYLPNKEQKGVIVHKEVVQAYVRLLKDGEVVNHLNGNKTDNRLENLQITTHSGNTQHAYDTGLIKRNGVIQFDDNGKPIARYSNVSIASKNLGIPENNIRAAIQRKGRSAGFKWMYDKDYTDDLDLIPLIDAETETLPQNTVFYGRPVVQLSLDGNPIARYPSISIGSKITGIAEACIRGAIRRNGTSNGFKWIDQSDYHDDINTIPLITEPPKRLPVKLVIV